MVHYHSIMKRIVPIGLLVIAIPPEIVHGFHLQIVSIRDSHNELALAGGFGASSSSKESTSNPKRKKTRNGLQDIDIDRNVDLETTVSSFITLESKLDKWGFPPPTEEDLFPFMPLGTELIAAPLQIITRQQIKEALQHHSHLTLDRFDDNGVEIMPSPGNLPMTLRMIHQSPPVLAIDHFFSNEECQAVQHVTNMTTDNVLQVTSATFSPLAQSKRTSTSWFCNYSQMTTLLTKAHQVLGIPIQHMEEPQIVRYRTGEEFSWHYDEVPRAQLNNGGQRVMTLLVYLNNVSRGGGTIFRDLNDAHGKQLTMKPQQGSALLFFPAYKDGTPDDRTLHKGEIALEEKWITQMWIHQHPYHPVVPPGNTHDAAMDSIAQRSIQLGYV